MNTDKKDKKERSQLEKFKQAARELGADQDEATFDQVIWKMKPPPDKADKPKKKKPGQ
ncbi:MAG: hypothetical protein OEN23_08240 [Paracoccaceae bacterium]|nr:hypothetical protein [Paracoccaceae bacterium]